MTLLSLASGVLPEFSPIETAAAAIAAGWPAVGIWVDPKTWTATMAGEVRSRAADAGITVLDVEVVWLQPGADDPDHFRIIDAGADIGAKNVLVVSSDPDAGSTAAKLARLVDHGAAQGLRVCLEFGMFTAVRGLRPALDILDRSGSDAGVLIDPLHFVRTGSSVADLACVDPRRLPYAQFCDGPAAGAPAGDFEAIIREALDLRLDVGAGEFPLAAIRDALPPATPLSIELRSKTLRDAWPDAADRARALLASTRAGLAGL